MFWECPIKFLTPAGEVYLLNKCGGGGVDRPETPFEDRESMCGCAVLTV